MRNLLLSLALALPISAQAGDATRGDLTLSGAFTRATLPHAPVAGGFLAIANHGAADDRLTGGSAAFAGRVEIHEMAMQGDVMKMRELEGGLPIPAGQTVTLQPGGYHIMFMDLKSPLKQGETAEVTLTFEKAGSVTVPLDIQAPGAKGMKHDHSGMKMN